MEENTVGRFKEELTLIIKKTLDSGVYQWLIEKAKESASSPGHLPLTQAFTAIPRKTGKEQTVIEETDQKKLQELLPGFTINGWTVDRLARVWLLSQLAPEAKKDYVENIEKLFLQADMNELVALYSSLSVLAFPEEWKWRCAEGIRSNIGSVLEAVMYHNPYPAAYLEEGAWNQLVMKAFFTEKNVNNIIGLDERSNPNLANTIFDYIEERWAAGRTVDPQIWRLVGKFMDDAHFYMLEKLFEHDIETDRQAAALACAASAYEKADVLLNEHRGYKKDIQENKLNWRTLAAK